MFSIYIRTISVILFATAASMLCHAEIYIGGSLGYSFLDSDKIPVPSSPLLVESLPGPVISPGFPVGSTSLPPTTPVFLPATVDVDTDQDDEDNTWNLFLGYRFNPIFSLELMYIDLGKAKAEINTTSSIAIIGDTLSTTVTQDLEIKTSGVALLGIFSYPTEKKLIPYGKVGVFNWKEETSSDFTFTSVGITLSPSINIPSSSHTRTGNSLILGFGARYEFSPHTSLRMEYDYFDDIKGRDIETLNIGIEYYLGQ